jgi:hypothetical protein
MQCPHRNQALTTTFNTDDFILIVFDLELLHSPSFDKKKFVIVGDDASGSRIMVRCHRSKNIISIPKEMSNDLAYLIGAVLGDGNIGKPLRRKRGGYYCTIRITCKADFGKILSEIIERIFNYAPRILPYKKNPLVCDVCIHSMAIYRFFTEVLSIPGGRKAGHMPQVDSVLGSGDLYRNYLAGLIDTDGYVHPSYAALVQKDRAFLERVREQSKRLLDIDFVGPTPNRRINGEVVGWWIRINKSQLNEFISKLPLRYRAPVAQLG